jgi:hypothetical protein
MARGHEFTHTWASSVRSLGVLGTNVTDITPLADNPGLSQGDTVFVQGMSLADCQAHLAAAQALKDRGVTLLVQCL